MQHLFKEWNKVRSLLRKKSVFLFLDYDGTLTPIVAHPNLAKFSREGKRSLRRLSFCENIGVAVVSGRALPELKRRVGVRGICYAGNHGLEFEGPGLSFTHPKAQAAVKRMAGYCKKLRKALRGFPGVFVENKVLTLSVHYRRLPLRRVRHAKEVLLKTLRNALSDGFVILGEGKKVWEIRPPVSWDKGTMALWILDKVMEGREKKILPVYAGDDKTDEDAFKALEGKGISVKITPRPKGSTAAPYYLRSPGEVLDFLGRVERMKEGESHGHGTFSFPNPLPS